MSLICLGIIWENEIPDRTSVASISLESAKSAGGCCLLQFIAGVRALLPSPFPVLIKWSGQKLSSVVRNIILDFQPSDLFWVFQSSLVPMGPGIAGLNRAPGFGRPIDFTQKGGGRGLRPERPLWQTYWILMSILIFSFFCNLNHFLVNE